MSVARTRTKQRDEATRLVAQGPVKPIGGDEEKNGNPDILARFTERRDANAESALEMLSS